MLKNKALSATAAGPEGAWDLSYAYYDPPEDLRWDLSTAEFANKSASVSAEELNPNGIFFKSDGTKMYVTGSSGDDVNEYNLSIAWDIMSASYLQNFSVAAEDTTPRGVSFKPDGTRMYIAGDTGNDINEYSLSTAWDVSTASYVQNFSVGAQEGNPQDLFFKPDGTKMYICGSSGQKVYEYDLSTPWDVSSASFLQDFSVATEEGSPTGVFFKPDGTKMYILGSTGDDVNEYDLSTPWDISSASYVQNFSVFAQDGSPSGIFFKPDGTAFYIVGADNDAVRQYCIGGFLVAAEEISPAGISFKTDGTRMYIVGSGGDDVNEYSLSTAWDTSTASYVQNFSVATEDSAPTSIFFKSDGTRMYILGGTGDDVNEYSLSTAWDVSTASYVQNFSVAAQDTNPQGIFFKPDGTRMYIVGATGDAVYEYSLSTAWDVSTASYVQNFSVASEETGPQGISFKPDGTRMYIVGTNDDAVNEYSLSTAWDVSTASYVQNFSVIAQDTFALDIFFKPDGTQMFIVGNGTDSVYSYTLGVQP